MKNIPFVANPHTNLRNVFITCLFLLSALLNPASVAGQQNNTITVNGTIIDEYGEALIGATVKEKGTTNGTVSDIEGNFTLVVKSGAVLQVSYIGYISLEVAARPTIQIVMKENAEALEEVVVVAYGKQKKVSVTAAVSTINTKELKQSPSANLAVSLAGRMPGLTALQSSGQPGADAVNLYLRGMGTYNDASPLILIDGVPRSGISTLDPNEVATVTILKDASATAVFGVRGANGVILITTKRGTSGASELSISADYSVQSFIATPDRISSAQFAALRNEAYLNVNPGTAAENLPFTPYMISMYNKPYSEKTAEERIFYPDRDVFHDYFRDYAPQTRINANFNGGSEDFIYFLNVGYIGQGGQFKTEPKSVLGYDPSYKMDRYNFRGNIDYNISKKLKSSLNIATYLQKVNSPMTGEVFGWDVANLVAITLQDIYATPPSAPGPLTVDGYGVPENQLIIPSGDDHTIYGFINRHGYEQKTSTTLNSSLSLDWDMDFITKGLTSKAVVAFDVNANTDLTGERLFNEYGASVAKNANETNYFYVLTENRDDAIIVDKLMGNDYYLNYQLSLNYARDFGKHKVSGLFLHQRDNWGGTRAEIPYNIWGLVGRATYNFDDRYLAEFNIGYNGSEQFAPDNRFGVFPAYSLGWVVSNESFMQDQRAISNLKLRASYGETGNDKLGDSRFLYQSTIYLAAGSFSGLGNGQSIVQGYIGNDQIQWEVAKKTNLGLDLEVLRMFTLTADFYKEHRNNILISRGTIPILQGVPIANLPKVNLGEVDNRGFEVELGYNKLIGKDWLITLKTNFAYNENKILEADEVPLGAGYKYQYRQTGFSIGQNFGYQIDYSNGNGFINTQEELDNLPTYDVGGGQPRLGDFKYVDQLTIDTDGDGIPDASDGVINVKDQIPIGYSKVPRVSYGFSGSISWKSLDFSFLFTGIAKSSMYLTGAGVTEIGKKNGFYNGWHLQAWTQERYANGEEILYPSLGINTGPSQYPNSVFIMDRDFFRLKNLEIGYNLPAKWVKKASLSKTRVYVNGNNLFTWKKYPINTVDPEQTDNNVYGLTRMINFGINVVF
jgi:TonB-linked SusC/RagA family outer membrane protein